MPTRATGPDTSGLKHDEIPKLDKARNALVPFGAKHDTTIDQMDSSIPLKGPHDKSVVLGEALQLGPYGSLVRGYNSGTGESHIYPYTIVDPVDPSSLLFFESIGELSIATLIPFDPDKYVGGPNLEIDYSLVFNEKAEQVLIKTYDAISRLRFSISTFNPITNQFVGVWISHTDEEWVKGEGYTHVTGAGTWTLDILHSHGPVPPTPHPHEAPFQGAGLSRQGYVHKIIFEADGNLNLLGAQSGPVFLPWTQINSKNSMPNLVATWLDKRLPNIHSIGKHNMDGTMIRAETKAFLALTPDAQRIGATQTDDTVSMPTTLNTFEWTIQNENAKVNLEAISLKVNNPGGITNVWTKFENKPDRKWTRDERNFVDGINTVVFAESIPLEPNEIFTIAIDAKSGTTDVGAFAFLAFLGNGTIPWYQLLVKDIETRQIGTNRRTEVVNFGDRLGNYRRVRSAIPDVVAQGIEIDNDIEALSRAMANFFASSTSATDIHVQIRDVKSATILFALDILSADPDFSDPSIIRNLGPLVNPLPDIVTYPKLSLEVTLWRNGVSSSEARIGNLKLEMQER